MRTSQEQGASVAEFGLLLAALAAVLIGALSLVGGDIEALLTAAVSGISG